MRKHTVRIIAFAALLAALGQSARVIAGPAMKRNVVGVIASVERHSQVTLQITEAGPGVKGQTAGSAYKPAMLENGIRVLVPPFIGSGERIVVDTNEITYVRRAD